MIPDAIKTLQMLNFDAMINFDEIRNIYCCFWCLDLDIFHTNLSLFKSWLKFHLTDT